MGNLAASTRGVSTGVPMRACSRAGRVYDRDAAARKPDRAMFATMPISARQRHRLIVADRSFDCAAIATAVRDVLGDNPALSLFDVEVALRDARCWAFLIAAPGAGFDVAGGVLAHRARLSGLDRSPAEKLALLAAWRAADVAAMVG
jgi:hypothetical protein